LKAALELGCGFDGSSIQSFTRIDESNMVALPVPTTFQIFPWRPRERQGVAKIFRNMEQT
jgi:glutamine synthetase